MKEQHAYVAYTKEWIKCNCGNLVMLKQLPCLHMLRTGSEWNGVYSKQTWGNRI